MMTPFHLSSNKQWHTGQSELLMNFVCSATARNLDLSAVLVFATDEETKELAEGLGLTAFFDRTVRGYGN